MLYHLQKYGALKTQRLSTRSYLSATKCNELDLALENDLQTILPKVQGQFAPPFSLPDDKLDLIIRRLGEGADPDILVKLGDDTITALSCACWLGNADLLRVLIQTGADLHQPVYKREFVTVPLIAACESGDFELVHLMLKYGADPNIFKPPELRPNQYEGFWWKDMGESEMIYGKYSEFPLMASIGNNYRRDLKIIELLLEYHADINFAPGDSRNTAAHYAAAVNPESLQILIKKGANINAVNSTRQSVFGFSLFDPMGTRGGNAKTLLKAGVKIDVEKQGGMLMQCAGASPPAVDLLLSLGVDINAVDEYGKSSLWKAIQRGKPTDVEFLLSHGADPNLPSNGGETPLELAAQSISLDPTGLKVKALLKHGANINHPASDGSPLMRILLESNPIVYKFPHPSLDFFLEQQPDLNIQDENGETVLFKICEMGNIQLLRKLVEAGADINVVSYGSDGTTPMHAAVENNWDEIFEFMLSQGPDVHITDGKGNTLLHKACRWRKLEWAEALVSQGGDIKAKNKEGKTPLDLVPGSGRVSFTRRLKARMRESDGWVII